VKRPKWPAKRPNVLLDARARLASGAYRDTRHAFERKRERALSLLELRQAIHGGYHEAQKDTYKPEHKAWNYAIRGRTLDERDVRVVVTFVVEEGDLMLFVTAMDLDEPEKE
jgi:hypothetical protein